MYGALNLKSKVFPILLAVFAIFSLAVSCQKDPSSGEDGELLLYVPKQEFDYGTGNAYVHVTAPSSKEWTLSLQFNETDAPWAWFGTSSARSVSVQGKGEEQGLVLNWALNDTGYDRGLTLHLECGSLPVQEIVVVQKARQNVEGPVQLTPDPVPGWMELPATNDKDLYFFRHDMTFRGGTMRNYSYYLDPAARVAVWVAYPLNKFLAGTGSRTDRWGVDPKVPTRYQAVLFKSFKGYDRGHQLPSADRLASGANETTFYGTNMTPQLASLNQHDWSTLEGRVRSWADSFDTLYVVTGADLRGYTKTADDNYGQPVAVPTGYFKALLGYKKSGSFGITPSTGGYTGIGFYYEHRSYGDTPVMNQAMTLSELERKTGLSFFVGLSAAIGQDLTNRVKTTRDSWWN